MENYPNKGIRTELQRMYRIVGAIIGGVFAGFGLFLLIFKEYVSAIVFLFVASLFFVLYIEVLGNFRVRKRRNTHREILANGMKVPYKLVRVGQNPKKKEQNSRRPQLVFHLDLNKELVEIRTHRFDLELVMMTDPEGQAFYFPSKFPEVIIPSQIINYHGNRDEFQNAVNFSRARKFHF